MALPAPWLLWTLLLLAPALSSQQGAWDAPSCTEGVVTVPRGQRALMSCTSSSPFTHVDIRLRAPRKPTQLIFREDTPGDFSSAGWRLVVRGGEAQLVIQDAQPSQAGEYTWVLTGRQGSTRKTRLEVTAPPDEVPAVTMPQDTGQSDAATPQPRNHYMIVVSIVPFITGVGLFAWCGR